MAKRNGSRRAEGAAGDDVALTLVILRAMRGWNQDRLAKESGVRNAAISEYEGAKKVPELRTLRRLLAAMGWRFSVLDHTRRFVELLRLEQDAPEAAQDAAQLGDLPSAAGGMKPSAAELGLAASQASAAISRLAGLALLVAAPQPGGVAGKHGAARKDLAPLDWTACARLCEESLHAAARDGGQTAAFAEAALAVAEPIEGKDAWRCRVRGYALAHLANARRVQGDLPAADAVMAAALAAWARGVEADDERLDEALVISLEASLRRANAMAWRRPLKALGPDRGGRQGVATDLRGGRPRLPPPARTSAPCSLPSPRSARREAHPCRPRHPAPGDGGGRQAVLTATVGTLTTTARASAAKVMRGGIFKGAIR